MEETNTDERLKAGTVIDGRYTIKTLIGTGGFANVYLAEHNMLGTDVAVKVLHAPLATSSDTQFAARFEREARVAAQMRHPNVVNVTDFGFLEGGDPYIVMEHLQGRDLDEELRQFGPMAPDRLLRLMIPAIQACGEAHRVGVVHKDLKPSNLFLVDAGSSTERLVVLDFGVARVFDDADANITQTGAFTGTPAYLPPEYIREQRVTAAFDVYQMGLILIESMTGRQAIQADGPMGFLLAHCMGRLTVTPDFFDNELGAVIKRSIAIEDSERYPDCSEMASALLEVSAPDAATFSADRFVTEPGPMSSHDVAAFADTISSGQLVGDSFVTGTGTSVSGPDRPSASQQLTAAQGPAVKEDRGTVLYVIAGVLFVAIAAAGLGIFALVSESDEAVAVETDGGMVEPVAMPTVEDDEDEVVELDEPEAAAELAAEELAKSVDAGAERAASGKLGTGADDADAEGAAGRVPEIETADVEALRGGVRKKEEQARAAKARRLERLRERRLAEEKRAEEKKKEAEAAAQAEAEAEADEKPQERLLLVD